MKKLALKQLSVPALRRELRRRRSILSGSYNMTSRKAGDRLDQKRIMALSSELFNRKRDK